MTLRELRLSLSLTQKQMGEALGIQKQTHADMERGRSIPSGRTLIKIAKTFNVCITISGKGISYKK